MARARKPQTPFYSFNWSPEVIRLVVMMDVQFPLSLAGRRPPEPDPL